MVQAYDHLCCDVPMGQPGLVVKHSSWTEHHVRKLLDFTHAKVGHHGHLFKVQHNHGAVVSEDGDAEEHDERPECLAGPRFRPDEIVNAVDGCSLRKVFDHFKRFVEADGGT